MSEKVNKLWLKCRDVIVVIILIIMAVLLFKDKNNKYDKKNTVNWLYQNTDWKKMSKIEGDYTSFMYDVINIFSSKSIRTSMTKEMRIKHTTENFKLARGFGYGYFDATILGLMETDLNPHAGADVHIMGEVNMYGHCYTTAKYYYSLGRDIMPTKLWKMVRFEFKKKEDLKDPINALKMTYIWLWIEYRNYRGSEMWAISGYRWGRFVYKHWADGTKKFPIKFVIYTKFGKWVRNPKSYYWTWKKIKTCLENGDIDGSRKIMGKWKKKRSKLKYEEIEYRRVVKVFKDYEREIKELKFRIDFMERQYQKVKNVDKKKTRILKQIGGQANKKGWTKKLWNDVKTICKESLKKIKYKEQSKIIQILIIAGCGLIILFILFMSVFGIVSFIKRIRKK